MTQKFIPEDIFEREYERHTGPLVTICWEHGHVTHHCIFNIYAETY